MHNGPHESTYTPAQAAEVLSLSKRRVLQMLERGELAGAKDEAGRWGIPLFHVHALLAERQEKGQHRPEPSPPPPPPEEPSISRELVDTLKEQNAYLRQQLDAERESRRRADHLLAQLTQANATLARRVPELEAPSEATGSPEAASGTTVGVDNPADEPAAQKPAQWADDEEAAREDVGLSTRPAAQRQSWWRRVFGS